MTNFLSQPTIEAIQTLLIIGNVLSYNMNPGISYVLLGMDFVFFQLLVTNVSRYDITHGTGTWFTCRIESFSTGRKIPKKTCLVGYFLKLSCTELTLQVVHGMAG